MFEGIPVFNQSGLTVPGNIQYQNFFKIVNIESLKKHSKPKLSNTHSSHNFVLKVQIFEV